MPLPQGKVLPNQKNGELGHGKERADAISQVLDKAGAGAAAAESTAWEALRAVAQDPNPADITSNTQRSAVFSNTDRCTQICLRRHWGDVTRFEL